jgi:hypothetical protein
MRKIKKGDKVILEKPIEDPEWLRSMEYYLNTTLTVIDISTDNWFRALEDTDEGGRWWFKQDWIAKIISPPKLQCTCTWQHCQKLAKA